MATCQELLAEIQVKYNELIANQIITIGPNPCPEGPPPQPSGTKDKFGIPYFHKSKPGGFNYEMSDDPENDEPLSFDNITFKNGVLVMKPNGPTSFSVGKNTRKFKDSIGGCGMNFKETAARGYAGFPDDVRDLEFKTLVNIKGIGDHGFSISARTGHHDSKHKPCCQGFAYMFNMDVSSGVAEFRFRKEIYHVEYYNSPEGWFKHPKIDFQIDGHGWVGFGFSIYNITSDSVAMEGWFNTHPEEDISDWFMVKKIVDHPGNKWGKNGNKCGGAPDQVGTWSGSHNRLKTNATSGEIDFKNISFREITPELLVTV
jgi:hypothetical protein